MFMLKYALIPFLLPPGIFIIFLILSALWFSFQQNRKAVIVNLLIGFLMWALSITPVSNAMFRVLESNFNVPGDPQGDVIILLGGGVYDRAPDMSGEGIPSEEMLYRIVTAARLQKSLQVPIIVSAGTVFRHIKVEAPIVRRFLFDLGVPDNKIIMEAESRDTLQNAKNSREICLRSGYKTPILVTSAFHLKRAIMAFKKAGIEVLPFPSRFRSWENRQYGWNDYLPGSFAGVSIVIREYLGLLFYKIAY